MIVIKCSKEKGFRRGGIVHKHGTTHYAEDFFSAENLELIKAEPQLMVQTGVTPDGPGTMSMDEIKKALADAKAEFNPTDPRGLLVSRLSIVLAEIKQGDSKPKAKKTEASE